jgi:hypothetical protein
MAGFAEFAKLPPSAKVSGSDRSEIQNLHGFVSNVDIFAPTVIPFIFHEEEHSSDIWNNKNEPFAR